MHDDVQAASSAAEEPPSEVLDPVLSDAVRRHLGRLLGQVYALTDVAQAATDRFADVVARLDAAPTDDRHDGGEAEFQGLLLAAVPTLYRFAMSLAHHPSAADDLVQETLLRAWRGRATFVAGTNFEAWAFTILRNNFYTDHRKRAREVQDEDGAYAAQLSSLPEQTGHLELADMRSVLAGLSAPLREALTLVAIENLSYEAAAAVMGCRIGTVKSRVWRARDQLARALGYGSDEIGQDGVMLSVMGGPV